MTDPKHVERLQDEVTAIRLANEVVELKRAGAELMQAAVLKLNKPDTGTMVLDPTTGRFKRVDARLIKAVEVFGDLLGISLGKETEEQALDRRAKEHGQRIEVVPHDPEGPQAEEDVRGCERKNNYNTRSGSGTSD